MRYNEKLLKLRKDLGLKQSEVAEQIYVQRRSIGGWEQGKNIPNMELLIDLAMFYDVSLDDLLSEEIAEVEIEPVNVQSMFLELTFPEKLRMVRKQLGLSQEGFAQCISASYTSVCRWEAGQKLPSVPMMVKLSKFLGIPIDDLLYDKMHEN